MASRSELKREAAFVGLTLLGMVTGLLTGWLNGPPLLMWAGYGVAYVFGGWYGLKGAIETLRHRAVDIDLLMIVAALGALSIGPRSRARCSLPVLLSNTLQHYAIGRSRRAIKSLVEMRPDEAQVLRDGEEVTVPIDDVAVGDVFVVRPGDKIPLDGVVTSGEGTVDQASLTGESVPVPKERGDEVFGEPSTRAEVSKSKSLGRLTNRRSAASSTWSSARRARRPRRSDSSTVSNNRTSSACSRSPSQRLRFHLRSVASSPGTFYRAMTLMVAASPCAVIISTPAAVLSAIASGGRQGVLFKGGEHVEAAANIDAVAFDKTGTLTKGDTQLTDVFVREGVDDGVITDDDLLSLAAAVQARSEIISLARLSRRQKSSH